MKIYDVMIDNYRDATQEDIDRLTDGIRWFGKLITEMRLLRLNGELPKSLEAILADFEDSRK